jgi:hypothetical protein
MKDKDLKLEEFESFHTLGGQCLRARWSVGMGRVGVCMLLCCSIH